MEHSLSLEIFLIKESSSNVVNFRIGFFMLTFMTRIWFFTMLLFSSYAFSNSSLFAPETEEEFFDGVDYVICVEGGGTKTLFSIVNIQGEVVSFQKSDRIMDFYRSKASNINTVGEAGVLEVISDFFQGLKIDQPSIEFPQISSRCAVIAGVAGLGLEQNRKIVKSLFVKQGISADKVIVCTDADVALGTLDQDGAILICGTGSICLGKQNGQVFRAGGFGRILGDEGSGYKVSLEAVKKALEQEYGYGIETELTSSIRGLFEVAEIKKLIGPINSGEMRPAQLAKLTPFVFEAASRGDKVAIAILDQAALDLSYLIVTVLKQMESTGLVHLWGGVFQNDDLRRFKDKILSTPMMKELEKNRKVELVNMSNENPSVLVVKNSIKKLSGIQTAKAVLRTGE